MDHDTFLKHYARVNRQLSAYIYSLLPRAADADDVIQRTAVVLWQKFDRYDPSQEFLHWACGVAFYEVRNFIRVSSRQRLNFDSQLMERLAEERPPSLATHDERLSALRECIKKLSPADRDLIDTAYGNSRSIKELAEVTGRAVQTLYNRMGWIRRRLLDCVTRTMRDERVAS